MTLKLVPGKLYRTCYDCDPSLDFLYFLKDTPERHVGCRVPARGAILMYVGEGLLRRALENHRFLYEGVVVVGNFEKGRIDEVFQPC